MTLRSGTKLGPYEILSPLGAGGMGEVYRARDTRLERTVAIKVLPTDLSSNPDLKVRFEREAKAISSLSHAHICTLHDVGHQDGIDFLVMEYLEGETLADRLEKGALPLKQALEYGIQIAEALEKAHRQGIVHRDLKPGNIMLTKAGAKLLDFGLAKPAVAAIRAMATPSGGKLTPSTPTMSVAALALRHSDLSTTMNAYVKSVSSDTTAAMHMLNAACATTMQPKLTVSAPEGSCKLAKQALRYEVAP